MLSTNDTQQLKIYATNALDSWKEKNYLNLELGTVKQRN